MCGRVDQQPLGTWRASHDLLPCCLGLNIARHAENFLARWRSCARMVNRTLVLIPIYTEVAGPLKRTTRARKTSLGLPLLDGQILRGAKLVPNRSSCLHGRGQGLVRPGLSGPVGDRGGKELLRQTILPRTPKNSPPLRRFHAGGRRAFGRAECGSANRRRCATANQGAD